MSGVCVLWCLVLRGAALLAASVRRPLIYSDMMDAACWPAPQHSPAGGPHSRPTLASRGPHSRPTLTTLSHHPLPSTHVVDGREGRVGGLGRVGGGGAGGGGGGKSQVGGQNQNLNIQ